MDAREKARGEVVRFRQVKKEQPRVHHDALEFPGGQIVLLRNLCQGQEATVLQLPAAPRSAEEEARCGRRLIEFGERECGRRNCGGEA
jgi:hypothetical protein